MKIGIVGMGVVGSATAATFRAKHFRVYEYDKFKSECDDVSILFECDVLFICLPTPTIDGLQDLSALDDFFPKIKNYTGLIILKSTVLPGTCFELINKYKINIIHSPEFLTAEDALYDSFHPHKIIIGYDVATLEDDYKLFELFRTFSCPIVYTDLITSELIKYACNCELAMQISYANELFDIAKSVKADYNKIKDAMLSDKRIGRFKNVTKERGYGGECLPKDVNAFLSIFDSKVMRAVKEVNDKVRK